MLYHPCHVLHSDVKTPSHPHPLLLMVLPLHQNLTWAAHHTLFCSMARYCKANTTAFIFCFSALISISLCPNVSKIIITSHFSSRYLSTYVNRICTNDFTGYGWDASTTPTGTAEVSLEIKGAAIPFPWNVMAKGFWYSSSSWRFCQRQNLELQKLEANAKLS